MFHPHLKGHLFSTLTDKIILVISNRNILNPRWVNEGIVVTTYSIKYKLQIHGTLKKKII
jgi:hypothetical protein